MSLVIRKSDSNEIPASLFGEKMNDSFLNKAWSKWFK